MNRTPEATRYFFTVRGAASPTEDNVGILLGDHVAAWQEAAQILTELARDEFPMGAGDGEISVQISDLTRHPMFRVSMRFKVEDLRQQ